MKYVFPFLFLMLFAGTGLLAQNNDRPTDDQLVQFSGMVLDGSTEQLYPIPYAAIGIKNESRGTYANLEGFFTIVATKGDTILFSALGYKDVEYVIPADLEDNKYSLVQLMSQDAINLPETVVFPWPSRDHFKLEFLAMDVTPELQTRAADNLSADKLEELRSTVATDGPENANYYLRQQSRQTYYIGQRPPMNIFSPVAWKQFFDGWKRGDFKKDRDRD
ncbi:hypothetical protein CEQ90_02035 [Lewinellaceae bacterium SD302]|nr:hypothetical protein CEQ90_02035 [Lewinellaceae bacterium SD302]